MPSHSIRHLGPVAFALAALAVSAPAFAAGDDSSNTPTCAAGQTYDQTKKECVKNSSSLTDKSLVQYAYALAKEGRYQEALGTLDRMANPNTAEALNYRGYATRKLGRVDEGIGYYLQAVALDPSYPLVREYLGEAYVIKGDLASAHAQLTAIEALCGTTCEPYGELADAISNAGA